MIKGLEDPIEFNESEHTYTHRVTGQNYLPVSKLISLFSKKFDREMISAMSAKKQGVSQAEVLADWDGKRDSSIVHGNRIHNALEKFEKTTQILKENDDLRPMILSVASLYKNYYRQYSEQRLRDDDYFICGTADKVMQVTSHAQSVIDIEDYKTNQRNGIEYKSKYGQYMLHCLSHLQDCSYNKYALQLSIYAYLLQKQTGRKIGMLNILYIPYDNYLSFKRIPVPYMKLEVEAMMSWYKENVLDKQQTLELILDHQQILPEETFGD